MEVLRLKATDYLDPETEAHYAFLHAFQEISTTPHCHDFYEIFLVVNGRVQHIVNDTIQYLDAGDLTFIRPDDVHYYRQDGSSECQLINLSFAQETMQGFLSYVGEGFHSTYLLTNAIPPSVALTPAHKDQVQARLEHLREIPIHKKQKARTNLRILLLDLFTQYFIQEQIYSIDGAPEWFNKLVRDLQEPQNFIGGIEAAYALADVSPEHMARTFKKFTQQTPTQFINELRLNYSVNLLLYTDRPILDIALETGFDSLSHFYHLFKEQFGYAPAQFRKMNQRNLIPFQDEE